MSFTLGFNASRLLEFVDPIFSYFVPIMIILNLCLCLANVFIIRLWEKDYNVIILRTQSSLVVKVRE